MGRLSWAQTLGKGTSGTAVLALRSADGLQVVLKGAARWLLAAQGWPADIELADPDSDSLADELKEVQILIRLNHPGIVSIYGAFVEATTLTIVMAYCPGGSMDKLVKERKRSGKYFAEDLVAKWLVEILLALTYMHAHAVLHRDLKPGNIFLTADGMVKVGDFGMARILEDNDAMASTACGTPYYLSPEICQGHPYAAANDIWAAGVVGFELLTLQRPFQGRNLAQVILQITQATHAFPRSPKVSKPACAVVNAMLIKHSDVRPAVAQLLEMEWLTRAFASLEATHPSLGVMPHSSDKSRVMLQPATKPAGGRYLQTRTRHRASSMNTAWRCWWPRVSTTQPERSK